MEHFRRIVAARRMVRTYTDGVVPSHLIDDLLDLARRAPSAGNTQPVEFVVLEGADTARYWDTTMPDPDVRAGFRWQGLLRAPVLVVPYVRPQTYVERYAEQDKVDTGLGDGAHAWAVPYWWVDGGAAVEHLLLGATSVGLGACLFGQFEHEDAVRAALGVPDDRRAIGTVSIGWPSAEDAPGRSAGRPRPALDEVVHRGGWTSSSTPPDAASG